MKRLLLAVFSLGVLGSTYCWATENGGETYGAQTGHTDIELPDIQPLDTIQTAVKDFVLSEHDSERIVSVKVRDLDQRLRLAFCQSDLVTTWSPGSRSLGRVTVQVRCESPKPWRVHVQATVTMDSMVWSLSRGVQRGDVLERGLLEKKMVTLGEHNSGFLSRGTPIEDIEPWLGFVFAQRVSAGKVINERMLKPAKLVIKGETVVIRHRAAGLELQTRGTALQDAGVHEQTQVRNTSSGKVIDVVVVAPGVVDILN